MYYLQNELTHFGIGILQYFEVKKQTKKLIKTFELHHVFIYQNVPISALCILLFVHHTTSILATLSTRCFEHSADSSCSLLVNPSHTDESWEGRNTCMWIYTLWTYSLSTLENTDENKILLIKWNHLSCTFLKLPKADITKLILEISIGNCATWSI